MIGTQLNTWIIGALLGKGTCANVYEVVSTIPLEYKYDKTKQFVIKVIKLPLKSEYKNAKSYKNALRNADTLYSEFMVYNKIRGIAGVPYVPVRGYGESQGYRYLVVERLDKSLGDDCGMISCQVASRYGLEIIKIIQALHSKNVLYVDMKPDNLMIRDSEVYLVDFGITSSFMTMKGIHKPQSRSDQIVGTSRFVSIDCNQGIANSRKDDIESLLYVLIYLIKGSLPWDIAKTTMEELKLKQTTSIDDLCKSLPREWYLMIETVRNYAFDEIPDYMFFEKQFMGMIKK